MIKGIEEPEELNAKVISNELFGEFKYFRDKFIKTRFGNLPISENVTPYALAMVDKMEDWPISFRKLRALSPICHQCKTKELFGKCKLCLKAVAGECRGFFQEATWMDSDLRAEFRKR